MKKLRPYLPAVVTLVTDVVTLGCRLVRQLTLPTLTRKGNLLSSLFVLFTGLIEQVIGFAEAVARVPCTFAVPQALYDSWVFSRKHLRKGMLIAAWALFILSSFEWSGMRSSFAGQTSVEQTVSPSAQRLQCKKAVPGERYDLVVAYPLIVHTPIYLPPISRPRWLLLCTLRI